VIVLRKFIIFLMFSAFLVGCQTPLIDIDVKHSSGGGPGGGGGTCPAWAIPLGCINTGGASIPLAGKVTDRSDQTGHIFIVEVGGVPRTLYAPPLKVIGAIPAAPPYDVEISYSSGEIRIK